MLIFLVWNKILKSWDTLFELIQIEVQCSKNYFKMFLPQEVWASGNNRRKGITKPMPKTENIYILNFYREYLLCLQSSRSGSFLQKCINFVEQQLKFSDSEGNTIP